MPNTFTSWGGLFDGTIKPDITAPGGDILSSVPNGGWKIASGTSMACPYVAGVAALYIGKYGGRSVHGEGFALKLVDTIISSGTPLPWPDYDGGIYPHPTGFLAPVPQIGNGNINAWKVLNSKTHLSFSKIHLNDTKHFSRYHKVEITNGDNSDVTYTFSVQPNGGFEAQSKYRSFEIARFDELVPVEIVPRVTLPRSPKLKPGESKVVQ